MFGRPSWMLCLRALVIAFVVVQANAGSVASLAGAGEPWWSKRWAMFARKGNDVCVVTYTNHGDPIDRYAWLGDPREPWYARKHTRRRMEGFREVKRVGRRLCERLGRGAAVGVTGVCATDRGWTKHVDRRNLCR